MERKLTLSRKYLPYYDIYKRTNHAFLTPCGNTVKTLPNDDAMQGQLVNSIQVVLNTHHSWVHLCDGVYCEEELNVDLPGYTFHSLL